MSKPSNEEIDYAQQYDEEFRMRVRPRSLISSGSRPVKLDIQDKVTGEWRTVIRMSRKVFNEREKEIFLLEYAKWGRMGESAAAAGVSTQTVRKAMEEDEDFAEAFLMQEEEYKDKLVGHHQNLVFNGTEKKTYDRNGNLVSEETVYPIRLIELELKKHDEGYRDKREVKHNITGGVLVAPAEMKTIDDWETRFNNATDVTPVPVALGLDDDDEDEDDS